MAVMHYSGPMTENRSNEIRAQYWDEVSRVKRAKATDEREGSLYHRAYIADALRAESKAEALRSAK